MRDAATGALMFIVVVIFVRLALEGRLASALAVLVNPGP